MTTSPRVVFFGNERLVSGLAHTDAPILNGLIKREYNIVSLVVNNRDATSRTARRLEVADIANAHSIPLISPHKLSDIEHDLARLKADFAILAAYGRIIPQHIIDIFAPIGILNIHPSLLPRHRGATPIESTILDGDVTAGVSIMQLTAGMDTGPVYGQRSIELSGHETKFQLYERLGTIGAELLFELLPSIISGSLSPSPQRTGDVSYTSTIKKSDGIIDPKTETAEQIERKVRAHLGFPKSRLFFRDNDVIITSSKVIAAPVAGQFCVLCKLDTTLLVESLIAPNGKSMSGAAYLRGLR